jgi:apolipoprotein N-acyltransferase
MAFAINYRRIGGAVLAIVATATMFYFGDGLNPLWPLMWIAPLPVLAFALRSKWWATAMVMATAMLLGNLNMWSYFTKTLGMPGSAWVGIFLAAGVVFAAGVLLFRVLVLRGAVWNGLVALPAVLVTSEYVRNLTTAHGSAGSLAYSQLRFLPFYSLLRSQGRGG